MDPAVRIGITKDEMAMIIDMVMNHPFCAIQKRSELPEFIEFLTTIPLTNIAEIGVARGGTFAILAKLAAKDSLLVGIDKLAAQAQSAKDLLIRESPGQRIELIDGVSSSDDTLQKLESALMGKKLDLLFIDGDHTYEGVKRDYALYERYVRPGGWIGFHDIIMHHQREWKRVSVHRLWAEIKVGKRHREIMGENGDKDGLPRDFGPWGGIGLLQQPESLAPGQIGRL